VTPRTSETDPIEVGWIHLPNGARVALTFAPGKTCPSSSGAPWARDLATDLAALAGQHGVEVLVSLITDSELAAIDTPELASACKAVGINLIRSPIPDKHVPTLAQAQGLVRAIESNLAGGRTVAIHCLGGLGRTGTIAGCLMANRGVESNVIFNDLNIARGPACPETEAQRRFVEEFPRPMADSADEVDRISRCLGAVLGGAIGDAMGHPTEFLSMQDIYAKYGPSGVTDFTLFWESEGRRFAPYTDDTQMAECVLVGLLDGRSAGDSLDGTMRRIADLFISWMDDPQGGHRAPGNACLDGCTALKEGVHWSQAGGPTAGGCGSVMRAYPFGLIFADDLELAETWAVAHSYLTHGDPIAQAACAAMAVGTGLALQGTKIDDLLRSMIQAARRYSPTTADMMSEAIEEARRGVGPEVTLDRLRSWAAHEAIAAAVYLVARHPNDPKAAILEGANTPGDSDSIATLAGALLGALCGVESLPRTWISQVERGMNLSTLARLVVEDAPAEDGSLIGFSAEELGFSITSTYDQSIDAEDHSELDDLDPVDPPAVDIRVRSGPLFPELSSAPAPVPAPSVVTNQMKTKGRLLDEILIIDLEATCWRDEPPAGESSEIIEIGLCVLDLKTLERTHKRSLLIRPERSKVSRFCTELTTLTQADVDAGMTLAEACKILQDTYLSRRRTWASFGDYDRRMLQRCCEQSGVPFPMGRTHLNVKNLHALVYGLENEEELEATMARHGHTLVGTHHRGHDDAWNIALVLAEVLRPARWLVRRRG